MPCIGESVPNRLSATAMDHRMAAQYGQNSAPMYSISGLPPLVSSLSEIDLIGRAPESEPMPTVFSVPGGTAVTLLTTLAGRAVPVTEAAPAPPLEGLLFALITMKAITMASTATTLPPARRIRLRISARRAAARCAAILSLAACCLILVALLMPALPHAFGFLWLDNGAHAVWFAPRRAAPPRRKAEPAAPDHAKARRGIGVRLQGKTTVLNAR